MVQRYGKDGAIDWNLNVKPQGIVEPKAVEGSSSKEATEAESGTDSKENKAPVTAASQDAPTTEKTTIPTKDDPEADIDSDEEAAFLEAGL